MRHPFAPYGSWGWGTPLPPISLQCGLVISIKHPGYLGISPRLSPWVKSWNGNVYKLVKMCTSSYTQWEYPARPTRSEVKGLVQAEIVNVAQVVHVNRLGAKDAIDIIFHIIHSQKLFMTCRVLQWPCMPQFIINKILDTLSYSKKTWMVYKSINDKWQEQNPSLNTHRAGWWGIIISYRL